MTALRRAPSALWRRSGACVVVLLPEAEDPVLLDSVGAMVWELLDPPMPRDELMATLSDGFERPPAAMEHDVGPFLDELLTSGAITEEP